MIARLMDRVMDFEEIESWYMTRSVAMPPETAFPKIGYIVPGIAAGFLIQTDTDLAVLEPFVSNPEKSIEDRDLALVLIMGKLVEKARSLGYRSVFGFSTHIGMVKRAVDMGFRIVEHGSTTVWKDLT